MRYINWGTIPALCAVFSVSISSAIQADELMGPPVITETAGEMVPEPVGEMVPEPADPVMPKATNVIENTGNGVGNSIMVENDGLPGGSTTIIRNVRNGFGNRVIIQNGGAGIVLGNAPMPAVMPAMPGVPFDWRAYVPGNRARLDWTERRWSTPLGCWLYLGNTDSQWYFYDSDQFVYRPWYVHPRY